jgi:branched-chain amino acid transport system substrate-binding protein
MKRAENILMICSLCLFLTVILLGGVPLKAVAADTFKIGIVDPFSGPMAHSGRMYLTGAQFAADEQNAKGGLLGKKIEILQEDSEFKPDVGIRKAKKLIMNDKVNMVGVGSGAPVVIAVNKVAEEYKTISINYGGTSDSIQGKEFTRYGFRVCMNTYNMSAAYALYLANKPYRKFYMIGPDYVFGYDSSKMFREQLKRRVPDATIVGEDFHPVATKDFGPYITKIIAANPDIVYISSFVPDLPNFVKQARAMGLKKPFPFLSWVSTEPYTMNQVKDDGEGLIYAHQFSLMVKTPEMEEMVKKYHEKHKNDADFLTWWPFSFIGQSILGWKMTFAAIEKAGSFDPEKIIEAYENFEWKSPLGTTYSMRKCDHQVILPMYVGMVKGGWNPFFNGSIRPDVKFPYEGPIEMLPAKEVALPATADYNPRCQ